MRSHPLTLFYGAGPRTFEKAKELRLNMTPAEKKLWERLSNKKVRGVRFKRQHPINRFVADFYCHRYKLVVEVDGGVHDDENQKEYDEGRTFTMNHYGIKVIRFTNEQVMLDCDWVVLKIEENIDEF